MAHTSQPKVSIFSNKVFVEEEDIEDDDAVVDLLEIIRMDRFEDATKHQKRMMHLWNSFKRKQPVVVTDAHVPWVCEAFTIHQKEELALSSPLLRCWNNFMVHLWELGLLHPKTMDKCLSIVTDSKNPEKKN